jgi:hypothetical protein
MPVAMKDPSRALLLSGVAVAAILAVASGFMFFANVPEPGAAREQIMATAPVMDREDIEKLIAERNALAPRPSAVAEAEASDAAPSARMRLDTPVAPALTRAASEASDGVAAKPAPDMEARTGSAAGLLGRMEESATRLNVFAADATVTATAEAGEDMFRRGLYPEALATWQTAAEAGDRVAAYRLGIEYLDGKPNVVARDYAEGAKWIRMAAMANEPRAQFELGSLYEFGNGVRASVAEAAQWYLRAAERNHPQGQYNIATMLETGEGIAQDRIEALKFYTLAANQGFRGIPMDEQGRIDPAAPDPLLNLRQSMPMQDVEEAEKRAAAFKPIMD